ncbi:hypothetical protein I6H07_06290 [Hafnia alvei]|uniref:hypothetical protein n=1 Tax=Hafnia alvei TaxID=569 RepID=UPI000B717613|nr:hypothetical protein [Hafnia alvei]MBI0275443.1 hypothetical protein [Hafnia alvei]PNK98562.1 hypothetical protein CEQ28_013695 [Hafnia alvei]
MELCIHVELNKLYLEEFVMEAVKKYDDNLKGVLFKNADKKKDTHPDYKGRCCVAGIWYWISVWVKKDSSGRNYMSQAFTEMTVSDVEQYVNSKTQTQTQAQSQQQSTEQGNQNSTQSTSVAQPSQHTQTPLPQPQNGDGWNGQQFDSDIPF